MGQLEVILFFSGLCRRPWLGDRFGGKEDGLLSHKSSSKQQWIRRI
jgi:hypothetical protein